MEISVKEAKNRLTELLRKVEAGERVTITRDGTPVVDLKKHEPQKKQLDWAAFFKFKEERGLMGKKTIIPEDFDDPLPEDFLYTINSDLPKNPR